MLDFFDLFQPKQKGLHESKVIKNKATRSKKMYQEEGNEEIDENKKSFSKVLLVQESLLIWIHTIAMLVLAYIVVFREAFSELPWLTAMVSLPWTAYAVSQHAYYRKAQAENTKDGIVYETAMQPYSETEDCR